jgi:N-sulfoglucosamine sulfohydrolase
MRQPCVRSQARLLSFLVAACGLLSGMPARPALAADRPNILWLVSEDNGPFLGCYGDKFAKTPRLDRMAADGILFTRAFANAPVCAPSRSTLITGVYATTLGTQNMRSRYPIPANVKFFSQYLRDAGYTCMNPGKTDYNIRGDDKAAWDGGKSWRDAPAGKPWVLVLNSMITHESSLHGSVVHPEYLKEPFALPPYHPDTPEIRSNWVEYYHDVTKMDAWVGGLLDRLERDGVADDTIVVYSSDHGGILPRSKRFCLDSGLHVPMIVRFGKHFQHLAPAPAGSKSDRLVSFVDLPPTFMSLAGAPIPPQFQGMAFLGPKAAEPRQYAFGFRNRMDETYDLVRTVRDARYRYVRNYLPHRVPGQHVNYLWQMPAAVSWEKAFKEGKCDEVQSAFWREKPAEELYDEQADPYEVSNLADLPQHRETLDRLRGTLHSHLLATRDTGFLPESDMLARAKGGPIREMAADAARYPLARILDAAELAARRDAGDVPRLIALMKDADPAVRFWAATGCCVRREKAAAATGALRSLLTDDAPAVRVAAAEGLCQVGRADEGLPALTAQLSGGDALLALNALDALGAAAEPAAEAVVASVANKIGAEPWSHEYVTRKAEWLLVKWGKAAPQRPLPRGGKAGAVPAEQ